MEYESDYAAMMNKQAEKCLGKRRGDVILKIKEQARLGIKIKFRKIEILSKVIEREIIFKVMVQLDR